MCIYLETYTRPLHFQCLFIHFVHIMCTYIFSIYQIETQTREMQLNNVPVCFAVDMHLLLIK